GSPSRVSDARVDARRIISASKIKSSLDALAGHGNRARTGKGTSPAHCILCLPLKKDDFKLETLTRYGERLLSSPTL
ncbi:MAG: hypothetical protein NZM10_06195, partial [Fimbriimonadales bacterium]|nr:hypothetical protein [Fimbriimonadales bacterium]